MRVVRSYIYQAPRTIYARIGVMGPRVSSRGRVSVRLFKIRVVIRVMAMGMAVVVVPLGAVRLRLKWWGWWWWWWWGKGEVKCL